MLPQFFVFSVGNGQWFLNYAVIKDSFQAKPSYRIQRPLPAPGWLLLCCSDWFRLGYYNNLSVLPHSMHLINSRCWSCTLRQGRQLPVHLVKLMPFWENTPGRVRWLVGRHARLRLTKQTGEIKRFSPFWVSLISMRFNMKRVVFREPACLLPSCVYIKVQFSIDSINAAIWCGAAWVPSCVGVGCA